MKQKQARITGPEDFNKHLQHTSPVTWIVLGLTTAILVAFFAWSFLFKLTIKIMGKANITSGAVTLHINSADLAKIKVGQKVYIGDKQGEILSFNDDQPVVTPFELSDGEYTYKIIIGEKTPISFLIGK